MIMDICSCMVTQDLVSGQERCRQCWGDIYACDCPLRHSIKCPDHPENKKES